MKKQLLLSLIMLLFVALSANAQMPVKRIPAALDGNAVLTNNQHQVPVKDFRSAVVSAKLDGIDEWDGDGEVEDGEDGDDSEIIIQEYSLEDMTNIEFRYYPDEETEEETGKFDYSLYLYPSESAYPTLMLDFYTSAQNNFEGTYSVKDGTINLNYSALIVEAQYPGNPDDDDWGDDEDDWEDWEDWEDDEDDPTQGTFVTARRGRARAAQAYFDDYYIDLTDATLTIKKNDNGSYTVNVSFTLSGIETPASAAITANALETNERYILEPASKQADKQLTMTEYTYTDYVAKYEVAEIALEDAEGNALVLEFSVPESVGTLDKVPEGNYNINTYYGQFFPGYNYNYSGYYGVSGTYLYVASEYNYYFLQEGTVAISYGDNNTVSITVNGTSYYGTKISVSFTGTMPTGLQDAVQDAARATKTMRNGQLLIRRGDKTYNVQGTLIR